MYLGLLVPAALAVVLAPETLEVREHPRFAPQALAVPPEVRGTFVRASLAGFSAFTISRVFGAVGPLFLGVYLGYHSHLLAGTVVFILFLASALGQIGLGRVSERTSLVGGAVAVVVSSCLLIVALEVESLPVLVICRIAGGIGQGLAVGAGLSALGADTPPQRRGEVSATFFVVLYVALAVPVVSVGLLAQVMSLRSAGVLIAAVAALLGTAGGISLVARGRAAVSGASS